MNEPPIRIWILGLFHSGTTIFWRSWRKDQRFVCFDEPLGEDISRRFPHNNAKGTHDEYITAFPDPAEFWAVYSPMEPTQALDQRLTIQQEDYIARLLAQKRNGVIDETRLHFHLPDIWSLTPDAYVIHLYRRASGFVTSHLLPSLSQQESPLLALKQRLGHVYRKHIFWSATSIPAGMGLDRVIGGHPQSKFGLMLSSAGYSSNRIMAGSAVTKLLAYWHFNYKHIETAGPRIFADRYIRVSYEDFALDPKGTMARLYDRIGLPPPEGALYPDVHPPKVAYAVGDERWRKAAIVAGFSEEDIDALL